MTTTSVVQEEITSPRNDDRLTGDYEKLPKLCGLCRTVVGRIRPEERDICVVCKSAGRHIDWADIEALDAAVDV